MAQAETYDISSTELEFMIAEGYLRESQSNNEEQLPSFMVKIKRLEFLEKQKSTASKTGSEFILEEAEAAAKAKREAKVCTKIL